MPASPSNRIKLISTEVLSHNWGRLSRATFDFQRQDGTWQRQEREVYDHGHAAVILLLDPQADTIILTRQFRYPPFACADPAWLVEACAGLLDGDAPLDCAIREAQEETGYTPRTVTHLYDAYMSPGSLTEKLSFFVGTYDHGCKTETGGGLHVEGEDIEVLEMPFKDGLSMIASGQIIDAKTIMILQHVALARALGTEPWNHS